MSDVIEELNQLAKAIQNPARIEQAGVMAAEAIRTHIYSGDGFAGLSAATTDYRGGRAKPLQDTGALRDSITAEVTSGNTAVVGTVNPTAPLHNFGGTISAKRDWLFIPAAGTRQLERKYGKKVSDVINGLKSSDYSVYRVGRTVCYRPKGKGSGSKPGKILYYLKKSVVIPKREFFYLTEEELKIIMEEVTNDIL